MVEIMREYFLPIQNGAFDWFILFVRKFCLGTNWCGYCHTTIHAPVLAFGSEMVRILASCFHSENQNAKNNINIEELI